MTSSAVDEPQKAVGPVAAGTAGGRALLVANRLPWPLDDGWKRRTYHLLRGLLSHGDVTLATLHGGAPAAVAALTAALGPRLRIAAVAPDRFAGLRAAVLGLVTGRPYHVWKQRSRRLERTIAELCIQPFDVAVATLVHLHPYLRFARCPHVVDTHNIDSLVLRRYAETLSGPRRWYAMLTARKLERHEREVFAAADMVVVCSNEEQARLRAGSPQARVRVVPNGVDTDGAFRPVAGTPVRGRLLFFGRLDYYPNSDAVEYFANAILPAIREAEPATTFDVAGPGASPRLHSLEAPGVRILGALEDLRPAIGSAEVVVVPLRSGGGTRLKILEALSLARPVVSTRIGVEGLDLEDGRDLLVADGPAEFAAAVVRLLRRPEEARALGEAGRETVCRKYSWGRIERLIPELVAELSPETAAGD